MLRKITFKIINCSLLLLLFVTLAQSAHAVNFQGLGILPAQPDVKVPFSESWFIYNLVPGETKKDAAVIVNNTTDTVSLKLYPVDGTTTIDGAFALMDETTRQNGIGQWIELSQKELTLSPGQKKTVNFTLSIPHNAPPGDHLGGIIIENKKIQKGETINVRTRIGVRVYQTVPGKLIKKLVLKDVNQTVNKKNKIVFTFALQNKGNVRVEPTGTFTLQNTLFGTQEKFDFDLRMVVPGKNTIVPIVWEKTPLIARVQARANITYGEKPSEKIMYDMSFWYIHPLVKYSGIIFAAFVGFMLLKTMVNPPKKRKK